MPSADPAILADLVAAAVDSFADHLQAVVLFGSAAEDRMRAVSDVNLVVVLTRFAPERADVFRQNSALSRAALRARIMFLRSAEIPHAAAVFTVKFADIVRRHRVLHGVDPFAGLIIPRAAALIHLRQTLLDLGMRLRERYLSLGGTPDQLALASAEAAGGMRACAAALLELEGVPSDSPREALQVIAGDSLDDLINARAGQHPAAGASRDLFLRLLALVDVMAARAEALA